MKDKIIKNGSLIHIVIFLYVILLPIYMPIQLRFLDFFGFVSQYFVFLLHIIGLCIIFLTNRRTRIVKYQNDERVFKYFVFSVFFVSFTTLIMTLIIQNRFGNIGEYSAISGSIRMIVAFIQYIFIIYFNKELFKRVSVSDLITLIDIMIFLVFIIGLIQVGIIYIGFPFNQLMDLFSFFSIFSKTEFIETIGRVTLVFTEPASAGTFISSLVFPIFYSKILINGLNLKQTIYFVFWLIILYNTKSSNAYFLFNISLLFFLFLYIKKPQKNKLLMFSLFFILLSVTVLIVLPYLDVVQENQFFSNIRYFSITKLTDFENQSTVARLVPLYVNWGAFKEYPFFGVGNGLQGYFFETYFPSFAYGSLESEIFLQRSRSVISTGGVFFPSLLSGYGLIGTLILTSYFYKCIKLVFKKKKIFSYFYYFTIMSWPVLFFAGFQGEFAGNYYIWFLFSLPFINSYSNNQLNGE